MLPHLRRAIANWILGSYGIRLESRDGILHLHLPQRSVVQGESIQLRTEGVMVLQAKLIDWNNPAYATDDRFSLEQENEARRIREAHEAETRNLHRSALGRPEVVPFPSQR